MAGAATRSVVAVIRSVGLDKRFDQPISRPHGTASSFARPITRAATSCRSLDRLAGRPCTGSQSIRFDEQTIGRRSRSITPGGRAVRLVRSTNRMQRPRDRSACTADRIRRSRHSSSRTTDRSRRTADRAARPSDRSGRTSDRIRRSGRSTASSTAPDSLADTSHRLDDTSHRLDDASHRLDESSHGSDEAFDTNISDRGAVAIALHRFNEPWPGSRGEFTALDGAREGVVRAYERSIRRSRRLPRPARQRRHAMGNAHTLRGSSSQATR